MTTNTNPTAMTNDELHAALHAAHTAVQTASKRRRGVFEAWERVDAIANELNRRGR